MIAVAIMIFGVSLFLRLVQVMLRPAKVEYRCPDCGLLRHVPTRFTVRRAVESWISRTKDINEIGLPPQPPKPSQNARALAKKPSDSGELLRASFSNSRRSSRWRRVRLTGVSTET